MLTCGISIASTAVQIDAKRDLLRRHQTVLPDIGADMKFPGVRRTYATLPVGFLAAGIGVIVDALRRDRLGSDAEGRGMAAYRQYKAEHDREPAARGPIGFR